MKIWSRAQSLTSTYSEVPRTIPGGGIFFSLSLLWGGIRTKELLAFFTFDAALVAKHPEGGIYFLGRLSPAGWYKQKMGGIVRGTTLYHSFVIYY